MHHDMCMGPSEYLACCLLCHILVHLGMDIGGANLQNFSKGPPWHLWCLRWWLVLSPAELRCFQASPHVLPVGGEVVTQSTCNLANQCMWLQIASFYFPHLSRDPISTPTSGSQCLLHVHHVICKGHAQYVKLRPGFNDTQLCFCALACAGT